MPFDNSSGTNPLYRTKAHKVARTTLVRAHRDGDLCCLCDHPMHGPTRNLHADHCPHCTGSGCEACEGNLVPGYRGLAHGYPCEECGKSCNQHDGAVRGNRRQKEVGADRWKL